MFFGSLATHRTFDFFHFILLGEAAQLMFDLQRHTDQRLIIQKRLPRSIHCTQGLARSAPGIERDIMISKMLPEFSMIDFIFDDLRQK
jgi:hypothetical protein